jgi:uncharacterized delta-60 repeat protein
MKKAILLPVVLLILLQTHAQDGELDPSFGTNGIVDLGVRYSSTAFQSDGKLLGVQPAVGGFSVTRYDINGGLDQSFGSGGTVTISNLVRANATLVEVENNGRIIVRMQGSGGPDTTSDIPRPTTLIAMVRFNTNGSLDTSFGTAGLASEVHAQPFPGEISPFPHRSISLMDIQNNGNIVVVDAMSAYRASYSNLYRYDSSGGRDLSFPEITIRFGEFSSVRALKEQENGKILVAWQVGSFLYVRRIHKNGMADTSFSTILGLPGLLEMVVQSDSKIILSIKQSGASTQKKVLFRYNADGTLDRSFGTNGRLDTGFEYLFSEVNVQDDELIVQRDGKIIQAADRLARYTVNGVLDSSFRSNGYINPFLITDISVTDNRLYAYGNGKLAAYSLTQGSCAPPVFLIDNSIVLNASCANNDGNISIIPTSGVAPFLYSKDGGATYVTGADVGYTFQNLPAGKYSLRLKDNTGCASSIIEREVKFTCGCTQPMFLTAAPIVLSASCGKNDGNISIIPTSGVAPFMYSIDGGINYIPGIDAGYTFQDLGAGFYQLRLKDATGCESVVVEKEVMSIGCNCTPPGFLNNGQIILNASCGTSTGNISIIPTTGVAPFMYSIDGGASYIPGADAGYTFQHLAPGVYQLRLKDATGCQSPVIQRVVKTSTAPTFLVYAPIVRDASCGMNDGNISIIPTSGIAPFMYSIDGGVHYIPGIDAGYTFQNLAAGNYSLRLKDATGCASPVVQKAVRNIDCPAITNKSVVGEQAITAGKELIIAYPNPSTGQFKLQLKNFASQKAELSVYDSKGMIIQNQLLSIGQNLIADFNLSGYAPGLYYIKIVTNSGTRLAKVLIQ